MHSVIVFCKTLVKGGAEKQALLLSRLLTEQGIKITLISWCGDKVDETNLEYIKKNSIKYSGLYGNPVNKFIEFKKIINRENVSIILSYLTLANTVAGISKLFNGKLLSIGGIRTEKLPFYKFLFERLLHNRINDATVFNNYSAKDKFERRGFNPEKIFVIHNAINIPVIDIGRRPEGEIRIVSVSRFVKSKDYKTALYSFKKLIGNCPGLNLKYLIVGYGPEEAKIRELASHLNLNNEVKIILNPRNIPELLQGCNIYLSTSLFEGLSNSIMEAMASGLPIVATDAGDNKYLVKDGINGYLTPLKDIDMICERLEFLSKSEDMRMEFGNNSLSIIRDGFTQNNLFDNYSNCFQKIMTDNQIKLI
jgi:glycosyltransferase involved in cell wall biosynthesis